MSTPSADLTNHRFLWGVATSAYQVEGAVTLDGRGPSIWDTFCQQPGKILDRSSGETACDHYRRMEDDVQLMKSLSLNAYRFSIAWPRVLPSGQGTINSRGLDFYDRLTDRLLENGIEPFPTLYHWDLPHALHETGGWTNRDIAHWFAEYAQIVVARLGDRIRRWTTLNEPHVFCALGYGSGIHAPGIIDRKSYMQAILNALRAHGQASRVLRQHGLLVGLTNSHICVEPLTEQDVQAAQVMDAITNRVYLDPLVHGQIPDIARREMERYGIIPTTDDLRLIHQPPDFFGVNYYMRMFAHSRPDSFPYSLSHSRYPGAELTAMGWEVYPQGLEKVLSIYRDDYGNIPVYITENGCAYEDIPETDGQIRDEHRIRYLQSHIAAMEQAQKNNCQVKGYFAWSFMDNFEWAHGYTKRFGLIYTDYSRACERRLKSSALWYRDWIQSQIAATL